MTEVDTSSERPRSADKPARKGMFSRLSLFFRQVIAELRKVIWPTRNELINYTVIVIVFVSVMAAIVAGLDYVFTKLVLLIFG